MGPRPLLAPPGGKIQRKREREREDSNVSLIKYGSSTICSHATGTSRMIPVHPLPPPSPPPPPFFLLCLFYLTLSSSSSCGNPVLPKSIDFWPMLGDVCQLFPSISAIGAANLGPGFSPAQTSPGIAKDPDLKLGSIQFN